MNRGRGKNKLKAGDIVTYFVDGGKYLGVVKRARAGNAVQIVPTHGHVTGGNFIRGNAREKRIHEPDRQVIKIVKFDHREDEPDHTHKRSYAEFKRFWDDPKSWPKKK